ncbi:MAG: tetratricopeptide repeat protein [Geminocystis sp.]|nr:tetratricopeptide repeat protein [Geminocystis sp.]HIK38742.1 tetratricopeptide repeat protein [Geminocystis sp. M7585_C2015_104]MCS7148580.1 tetratricopeptide repeat protein [Geminocystis sp.]MCX8078157.1 tetratricopeptide repeat protein [Geminocystis sp.]MDW8115028.1 tetratricopeptide repeat protein [Geminocystis sp.]
MEAKQDFLGYAAIGASIFGTVVGALAEMPVIAYLGITVGVGCSVFSSQQNYKQLLQAYNQQQQLITQLNSQLETTGQQLNDKLVEYKADFGNSLEKFQHSLQQMLTTVKQDMAQEIKRLDLQYQELNNVVSNIKEIENLSQRLHSHSNSAEFFYQRAVGYEKLGNYAGAIEDYTEAIKRDSNMAKAYHRRGVLYLEQGMKQKAVDDLRRAALLYFEQGDIESYHQAREMSRNIHEIRTLDNGKAQEVVVGSQLFSENSN